MRKTADMAFPCDAFAADNLQRLWRAQETATGQPTRLERLVPLSYQVSPMCMNYLKRPLQLYIVASRPLRVHHTAVCVLFAALSPGHARAVMRHERWSPSSSRRFTDRAIMRFGIYPLPPQQDVLLSWRRYEVGPPLTCLAGMDALSRVFVTQPGWLSDQPRFRLGGWSYVFDKEQL